LLEVSLSNDYCQPGAIKKKETLNPLTSKSKYKRSEMVWSKIKMKKPNNSCN